MSLGHATVRIGWHAGRPTRDCVTVSRTAHTGSRCNNRRAARRRSHRSARHAASSFRPCSTKMKTSTQYGPKRRVFRMTCGHAHAGTRQTNERGIPPRKLAASRAREGPAAHVEGPAVGGGRARLGRRF
eukprot:6557196-Prymnesium_polylepis.1